MHPYHPYIAIAVTTNHDAVISNKLILIATVQGILVSIKNNRNKSSEQGKLSTTADVLVNIKLLFHSIAMAELGMKCPLVLSAGVGNFN